MSFDESYRLFPGAAYAVCVRIKQEAQGRKPGFQQRRRRTERNHYEGNDQMEQSERINKGFP